MDTVQIRVRGIDKLNIASWAPLYPEFSTRTYSELSSVERMRLANKKIPYLRKFILHPDSELYIPRVEIFETANEAMKTVEHEALITTSLPKLIFANSLQEIAVSNRQEIFNTFIERLHSVGLRILPQVIPIAPISIVHFCKNIILSKEYSFFAMRDDLSRIDVGKAYDTTEETRKKDKNKVEALHLRCGTREWAFYDKVQEMLRPTGKSLEKQKMAYEKELIELYNLRDVEIFRYEYRLNKAQTIKSELNKALNRPYLTPVTFDDLFTDGLWKKVLLSSWKRILDRPENQLALIKSNDELDLLARILKNAKAKDQSAHSQNQALWSYGLALAIRKHGAKTIRGEIGKIWSGKADERLNEKLSIAADLVNGAPLSDGILFISNKMEEFKQITLESLDALKKE